MSLRGHLFALSTLVCPARDTSDTAHLRRYELFAPQAKFSHAVDTKADFVRILVGSGPTAKPTLGSGILPRNIRENRVVMLPQGRTGFLGSGGHFWRVGQCCLPLTGQGGRASVCWGTGQTVLVREPVKETWANVSPARCRLDHDVASTASDHDDATEV